MRQEHVEKIKGYYDRDGEMRKNEKYSGRDRTVYTKDGDSSHWPVMEPDGRDGMVVSQTDADGRITARDTYESVRSVVKCTGIERLCKDGRGMARFSTREAALINRLGGDGQGDTAENLKKAAQAEGDSHEKRAIGWTAGKLSELPGEVCAELVSTTRNRILSEREYSIIYRIEKIREQRKERESGKRNEPGRKAEKGGMEL